MVGALINSVFLYAQCFSIFLQAVKRFLTIRRIEDPKMLLVVGGVGLFINLVGLTIFGHGHGHDHVESDDHSRDDIENNGHSHDDANDVVKSNEESLTENLTSGEELNIHGVFLHVLADALGSVVVLISASVIWLTDWEYKDYLDPVLSLVIVVIISTTTWPLLRDSSLVLLNTIPSHIDLARLKADLVRTVKGVSSIHELHVWRLVGSRVVASCHLEMTPPERGMEPVDHHMALAREVKEYFHKAGIHSTTIQLEYAGAGEDSTR